METLFDRPCLLEAVLGRGVVSSYEAARLKRGTALCLSDRSCGDPVYLYFNGGLVGSGEVLIVDDLFCVRVEEVTWNEAPLTVAAGPELVSGTLETRVRLASCSYTLRELRELGRFGIVSFGVPYRRQKGAELLVAGMRTALGTVCAYQEQWAFRVDETLLKGGPRETATLSGAVIADPHPNLIAFDFTRPDKFSREQIRNLALIHQRFAAALRELDPGLKNCRLGKLDQMSYSELPFPGSDRISVAMAGTGSAVAEKRSDRSYFAQSEQAEMQVPAAQARLVAQEARRLHEASPFDGILFFYRDTGIFSELLHSSGRQELLRTLGESWKLRLRAPRLKWQDPPSSVEDAVSLHEMALTAELTLPGRSETLTLVYPAANLGKILHLLA